MEILLFVGSGLSCSLVGELDSDIRRTQCLGRGRDMLGGSTKQGSRVSKGKKKEYDYPSKHDEILQLENYVGAGKMLQYRARIEKFPGAFFSPYGIF